MLMWEKKHCRKDQDYKSTRMLPPSLFPSGEQPGFAGDSLLSVPLCSLVSETEGSPSRAGGKEKGAELGADVLCGGTGSHSGWADGGTGPGRASPSLNGSYLSCSISAARYRQEAGSFFSCHLSIYCCDYLDLYNLYCVRPALSPSNSVLGTAVQTWPELRNPRLIRAGNKLVNGPVSNQDLNTS